MKLTRRELGVGAAGLFLSRAAGAAQAGTELWSWASRLQILDLEKNGMLFTKRAGPMEGRGLAFEVLEGLSGPVADELKSERFARGRFAWKNAWATVLGFDGETYGDQLIKLELRPGATLARFDGAATTATGEVNENLAGFHFENGVVETKRTPGIACAGANGQGAYREIYVAEVYRWSRKSNAIAAQLERDISMLSRMIRDAAAVPAPCDWLNEVRAVWRGEKSSPYIEQLAFASPEYRPTRENLQRIIGTLQARLKL